MPDTPQHKTLKSVTTVISVNELTVFYLALLAIMRKQPYILEIDPLFPPFYPLLRRFSGWLLGRGRAKWIVDLCPALQPEWDYWARTLLYNFFAEMESWQNTYFEFDRVDRMTPRYAYAYKHLVCVYTKKNHRNFLFIDQAIKKTNGQVKIVGLLPDALSAVEAYWNRSFRNHIKPLLVPTRLVNAFITLATQAYTVCWIVSRLRLKVTSRPIFFAADFNGDPRDIRLYGEVADGGPILIVRRHESFRTDTNPDLAGYETCDRGDGVFTPAGFCSALKMSLKDGLHLFRAFHRAPPALYFKIAALPYRRAILRALFSVYKPRYFWGRDDYNVEHILRREEIRDIGGVSLGLNHGYSFYANFYPMWRYISFDYYFAFGLAQYNRFTKDTWAHDMKVIATGSFGATREDYKYRFADRPDDIAIFICPFLWDDETIDFIRSIAQVFPDRKIWLKIKGNYVGSPRGKHFIAACQKDNDNILTSNEDIFALFRKTSYVFSDPSTVVVEALQFGVASFLIDISKIHKVSLFREFPELCVHAADEAIGYIRGIEAGTWNYPWKDYSELVDLSGRVYFDGIRKYVNLPPKENPIPLVEN